MKSFGVYAVVVRTGKRVCVIGNNVVENTFGQGAKQADSQQQRGNKILYGKVLVQKLPGNVW